jgi:SAM-dependent methyltransferase
VEYDGAYYAPIGDYLAEAYLDYPFTRGTRQEVDFLVEALALPPGARVLDVGCGVGRHSLELARRGYRPLGVDISAGMLGAGRRTAAAEGLAVEFVQCDARRLDFGPTFDAAICLCEGAFGLAGDIAGHRAVLAGVARALKPAAPFVLTAGSALSAARGVAGAAAFDPLTCTLVEETMIRSPAGETKPVTLYTTCFTFRELVWLLEEAGFADVVGYGCMPGAFAARPPTLDDFEIMVLARRT